MVHAATVGITETCLELVRTLGCAIASLLGVEAAPDVDRSREDVLTDDDVSAILAGDHDRFARLVTRHQQEIARVIWRFVNRPEDLDELVHDVFVEAYLSMARFRPGLRVVPWLRTIAVHVGYRYWTACKRRRSGREVPLEAIGELVARAEEADPQSARDALHAMLEQLAPRDRLVLTLLHLEERSVADVAAITGWSPSMVKVQAHRARGRLRRIIEKAATA